MLDLSRKLPSMERYLARRDVLKELTIIQEHVMRALEIAQHVLALRLSALSVPIRTNRWISVMELVILWRQLQMLVSTV